MKNLILLIVLLNSISASLFAQNSKVSATDEGEKSYFAGVAHYATNSVYNGRCDSIVTPYLGAGLGYNHKSGINVSGELNFFPNRTVNVLDMGSLTVGYNHNMCHDKVFGSLSYSRYFYSHYSTQVGSAIEGTLSLGLFYDLNFMQVSMGAFLNHGDKQDIKINPSLSRTYTFNKVFGGTLKISPKVVMFAGTQNLMGVYIINRSGKIRDIKNHGKSGSTVGNSSSRTIS